MLGQLTVYIKGIRDDFITRMQNSYSGNKDSSGPPKGRNMPEIVNNIVWVRQLDSKVWFQTITVNVILLTFTVTFTCNFLFTGIAVLHMFHVHVHFMPYDIIARSDFLQFCILFNDLRKFDLLNKPL